MEERKKKKILSHLKRGEDNPRWKGEKVSYNVLHRWIKKYLKKPKFCQRCYEEKKLDLANLSQKYKRDLSDWEWLCRKCHMIKDGRLESLKKTQYKKSAIL